MERSSGDEVDPRSRRAEERDTCTVASVPPSVRGSVILGCTRDLQRDQLGTYARAMAAHGDIASFRIGPPGIGFTFDAVFAPEGARQVLAADSAHYVKDAPVITEFAHFLGNGLLVSRGERWRSHRRIVQPLFTRRAVANHLDAVTAAAGDLVAWCEADAAAGRPIDLHLLSMRYALHALGGAVFGEDVVQAAPTLREALPPLGEHLKRRSLAPLRIPHWWPSPKNRRAEQIRKAVWPPPLRRRTESLHRRALGHGRVGCRGGRHRAALPPPVAARGAGRRRRPGTSAPWLAALSFRAPRRAPLTSSVASCCPWPRRRRRWAWPAAASTDFGPGAGRGVRGGA